MQLGPALIFNPDTAIRTLGDPTRLSKQELRWLHGQDPAGGRTRNVNSGDIDKHCHSYTDRSILIAATLNGYASPPSRPRHPSDRTRTTEHGDPTAHGVVERIDQIDRAMHHWAHIYDHCPLCPDVSPPHDRHDTIGMLAETVPDLTDNLSGSSVLHGHTRIHIDALNMAHQQAAMDVLDTWRVDFGQGVEPDELRRRVGIMRTLSGRMARVCGMLGVDAHVGSQVAA